jgi:hypothetical protein
MIDSCAICHVDHYEPGAARCKAEPLEPRFSKCNKCGRTDRRAGVIWGCRECQWSQGIR